MFNSIKWLHVEPSTRCNAWCGSCARNKSGYGLTDFVIEDLKVERLKEVIDQLPNLETVQFCGNLGDPCASKIIDQQLNRPKQFFRQSAKSLNQLKLRNC